MDMVSIGYAALFGAIGAGCGALAGQLLARVFKFKSNILARDPREGSQEKEI